MDEIQKTSGSQKTMFKIFTTGETPGHITKTVE